MSLLVCGHVPRGQLEDLWSLVGCVHLSERDENEWNEQNLLFKPLRIMDQQRNIAKLVPNNREEVNGVQHNLGARRTRIPTSVVVDATHPRFLSEAEKEPTTLSVSTDDNFCQQCKTIFGTSAEEIRHHFRSVNHNTSLPCHYCGGAVYEYYYGSEKRYAHDCSSKSRR